MAMIFPGPALIMRLRVGNEMNRDAADFETIMHNAETVILCFERLDMLGRAGIRNNLVHLMPIRELLRFRKIAAHRAMTAIPVNRDMNEAPTFEIAFSGGFGKRPFLNHLIAEFEHPQRPRLSEHFLDGRVNNMKSRQV